MGAAKEIDVSDAATQDAATQDAAPRHLRLSASQITLFRSCARAWAWVYVAKVETPSSPAAQFGSSVHGELERYLQGGDIDFTTEAGYVAAAGLVHLPAPETPGLKIEAEFHFVGPSGNSYLGYKDAFVPPGPTPTPGVIIDHKTTSHLRWVKTAEDLRTDVQATLYAADFFREYPEEPDVELRWVYYLTKGSRKSVVTSLRVNQEHTWNQFQDIEKTAIAMAAITTENPLDLEPNVNHCSAFGGCPHQGRCNLSPRDMLRSHMEQNKLIALLKNKNGAANGAAASAAMPSPAPQVAAPQATTNAILNRLRAGGVPSATNIPVNPPEYQPPPVAAPQAVSQATPATVAPAAVAPAPAKRGRPKGGMTEERKAELRAQADAAIHAVAAQVAGRPNVHAVAAQVAAKQTELLAGRPNPFAAAAPGKKIGVLYLNCGPVGIACLDATELLVAAKKAIAEAGLADYRFAEYGQGPGMLAVAAAAALDATEGYEHVRLDTNTPEGQIVAVEFVTRATLVVR